MPNGFCSNCHNENQLKTNILSNIMKSFGKVYKAILGPVRLRVALPFRTRKIRKLARPKSLSILIQNLMWSCHFRAGPPPPRTDPKNRKAGPAQFLINFITKSFVEFGFGGWPAFPPGRTRKCGKMARANAVSILTQILLKSFSVVRDSRM